MPKATLPALPTSALFGIAKPFGPSSMAVINDLKRLVSASRLFVDEKTAKSNAAKLYIKGGNDDELRANKKGWEKGKWKKAKKAAKEVEAKMGQGGTLDPLADGVLVIGVNKGTKKLGEFLNCIKEYKTTCLLGCETDTYDSEGAKVHTAPWRHATRASVEAALEKFRGEIQQTPPVFSALKMDGKPLYEYARGGIPLPRPIERRKVTVHSIELTHWIPGSEHSYEYPAKKFTDEEREMMMKALRGVEVTEDAVIRDEPEEPSTSSAEDTEDKGKAKLDRPPAFVLSMRVSGGTYVRSIVHDLGHTLGSAAHVVTLTRSRQGRFVLSPETKVSTPLLHDASFTAADESMPDGSAEGKSAEVDGEERKLMECVPWDVFSRALENRASEKPGADGWREWEREVLQKLEVVEVE